MADTILRTLLTVAIALVLMKGYTKTINGWIDGRKEKKIRDRMKKER